MKNGSNKKLRGFTLMELIIVIAIIAILTAIIVPNMTSYMRSKRIEEANSRAQQIYVATQDYLTHLQASGVTSAELEKYFGRITSAGIGKDMGYLVVDMSIEKTHSGCTADCTRKVHYSDIANFATGASHGASYGEASSLAVVAANNIVDRLSEDFEGAWMVAVYPETFTVRYAIYSSEPSQSSGYHYNVNGVQAVGHPTHNISRIGYSTMYTDKSASFYEVETSMGGFTYRHSNCQETDYTNGRYESCAYTGQYPSLIK